MLYLVLVTCRELIDDLLSQIASLVLLFRARYCQPLNILPQAACNTIKGRNLPALTRFLRINPSFYRCSSHILYGWMILPPAHLRQPVSTLTGNLLPCRHQGHFRRIVEEI